MLKIIFKITRIIYSNLWKPLVHGKWEPICLNFIKDIGIKIQEKSGEKNATCHIFQAISLGIQKGNAHSIMGTLGPQEKEEEYFDILVPRADITY